MACFAHDLGFGGAQLYLTELINQLAMEEKIRFVVVAPRDGPLRADLESKGVQVEILDTGDTDDRQQFEDRISALAGWMRVMAFDVVMSNTLREFKPVLAAAKAGIPSVWAIHESYTLPAWSTLAGLPETQRALLMQRSRLALGSASFLVFESEATRAMFTQYAEPSRLRNVPYGLDTDEIDVFLSSFDRKAARTDLALKSRTESSCH